MKIHFTDSHLAVATWRNVQLQFFTGTMLLNHPPVIRQVRAVLSAHAPGGRVYSLTTILPTVGLPDSATREGSTEMLQYLSTTGCGSAYVIEGEGLRVSAMRTFISVMLMASHIAHPTRVFSGVNAGVKWMLSDGVGCDAPAADLFNTVEMLRRERMAALEKRSAG